MNEIEGPQDEQKAAQEDAAEDLELEAEDAEKVAGGYDWIKTSDNK